MYFRNCVSENVNKKSKRNLIFTVDENIKGLDAFPQFEVASFSFFFNIFVTSLRPPNTHTHTHIPHTHKHTHSFYTARCDHPATSAVQDRHAEETAHSLKVHGSKVPLYSKVQGWNSTLTRGGLPLVRAPGAQSFFYTAAAVGLSGSPRWTCEERALE